ncbi:MAG: SH3 domain-containing protein [Hungatella sp.]
MGTTENTSSWDQIRTGVKEAEQLIGQKQYNLSMVKSRQTLEYMVRCLAERACLVNTDLNVTIDELYQAKKISKATCEHYHKIRILGNKAVHEGSDNAYDANQAYHMLSQEVYTFANDYHAKKPKRTATASRSRKRIKPSGFSITSTDLLRLLIITLCVVLVIVVFQFIKPDKKNADSTSAAVTTEAALSETTATATETMAETTPTPVYKTNDSLNVRSEPSKTGQKLGVLATGTVVDYVKAYDDEWAVINYNGTEGYVASQYLIHD